jgi:pimeloyl-ACP methyl ester carboxylesterase
MTDFDFPVGYHHMHKIKIIDFQLNRWHSLGYCRLEDLKEAAERIENLVDFKTEMTRQAEKAIAEKRLMNAAFYFRAAEFFTHYADPDKDQLYDKFKDLFYNTVFANEKLERFKVPYEGVFLPSLLVPAKAGTFKKGTIVIHGGFDSYIEEFYSMASYFAALGHDVVMFEGPGQGAALREYGLPLTYEWEKSAKAVLDYFELDDVTWLGISMGGWLCFRASAYEPRIKRVIALSIAFDYMQIPPRFISSFARWLFNYPRLMNYLANLKMKKMPQENWGAVNLMYITKKDNPFEASKIMLEFNEENLKSGLVKQDVLILTGAEDHFIPLKMHHLQVKALTSAKSVTERIFTREEHGHNHCQIGNIKLALDTMADWIHIKE